MNFYLRSERNKVIMQARSKTVNESAVKKGEISIATFEEEEQIILTLALSEEEAKKVADDTLLEEELMNLTLAVSKSEDQA